MSPLRTAAPTAALLLLTAGASQADDRLCGARSRDSAGAVTAFARTTEYGAVQSAFGEWEPARLGGDDRLPTVIIRYDMEVGAASVGGPSEVVAVEPTDDAGGDVILTLDNGATFRRSWQPLSGAVAGVRDAEGVLMEEGFGAVRFDEPELLAAVLHTRMLRLQRVGADGQILSDARFVLTQRARAEQTLVRVADATRDLARTPQLCRAERTS